MTGRKGRCCGVVTAEYVAVIVLGVHERGDLARDAGHLFGDCSGLILFSGGVGRIDCRVTRTDNQILDFGQSIGRYRKERCAILGIPLILFRSADARLEIEDLRKRDRIVGERVDALAIGNLSLGFEHPFLPRLNLAVDLIFSG